MKSMFVKTANYERLMKGLRLAEDRGAAEAVFIFVHGHPGVGKTQLIESVAPQQGWIMLRAKQGWTSAAFLRALADLLKINSGRRLDALYNDCLEAMRPLAFPPIVIDEVQHCAGSRGRYDVIEKLRDFTDFTRSPAILVAGSLGTWNEFARVPQLASRVSSVVELMPYTVKDVQATFDALCDVKISADLCERITVDSKGLARTVANAIKAVESFARTNGLTTVTAADVQAARLCIDWNDEIKRAAVNRASEGPKALAARKAA